MSDEEWKFELKHYRCEWHIVLQEKDQYDTDVGESRILGRYPKRDDAVAALPEFAHTHPHLGNFDVWIPKESVLKRGPGWEYYRIEIRYREVELAT